MRKLLLLPALILALGFFGQDASADSTAFLQTYQGQTGNIDFFSFNLLCDECFDDNIDTDSGSSALGGQLGIDGNFSWSADTQSYLGHTPGTVRQGSTVDTVLTTFAIPGTATVNYHFYGSWGLFNDADGAGPGHYNPTIFTAGVDLWLTSSIACELPLQGGVKVCEKEEFFGLATIHTPFAQFQMRLKLTTVLTIDSTGVIGVRTAVVDAGLPIADKAVTFAGANPGIFVDPLFIGCTQPEGEKLTYSLTGMHLDASSVNLNHSARLNFAVLDPAGIMTWSDVDTPGVQVIDATFGSGVELTTDDVSFDLGAIAPDVTPPTIEPLGFFIGWEGQPIQLHADATDNCGAPALRWEFSDGGVAYGPNPEHAFPDNGVYTGQLIATDVTGLTTTTDFEVTVLNKAPEVSAGPAKSYDWGVAVPFHANGSDQGPIDQGSLLYSWDFDDPVDPLGAAGQDVVHTYSAPGLRTAQVTVTDKEGATSSASVPVTVTQRDSVLSYTGAAAGRVTDTVLLQATSVGEYGEPLVGRTVSFAVGGVAVGAATTDGNGVATLPWSIPAGAPLGNHPVVASFAGDALYKPASTAAALQVISVGQEVTVLSYTGPVSSKPAKAVTLSATLQDDEGNPVAGKTVEFALGSQSCSAVTDGFGRAVCTIAKLGAKAGQYPVVATFLGDATYLGSSDLETFSVGK